jgi:hypothetical protein
MMTSRFLAQFHDEVHIWHRALFNVNEVFLLSRRFSVRGLTSSRFSLVRKR